MARAKTWLERLSFRAKVSLASSFLAIIALWTITPSSGALFHPLERAQAAGTATSGIDNEQSNDILNSIVVPSYNEGPNLEPLVSRIFQALPSSQVRHTEILVIDDNSSDDTADIIERLREAGYNVHLHVRTTERGLSSAVLHGFTLARGSKLLVMDADLQHPPESVPTLLEALEARRDMDGEVPGPLFALGTRYGKGIQMDKDWPVYRRIISWGARMLSRPLTNAQDPMGGFFALRKTLFLASQPLNPSGFKIGLELLLKTPLTATQLTHVPYGFAKRQTGSSKLGMKVMIRYVGQLLALYRWRFGLLFPLFVASVVVTIVYAAFSVAEEYTKRSGRQNTTLGRALRADRTKRRKQKSDV